MIAAWLDQPIWLIFAILAGGFGTVAALIFTLSFTPALRPFALSFSGIVPPYFNAIAILLALLTGFVANEAWERQKQAERVVQAESDHVLSVYDLSIATAPDMSKVRAALRDYVTAVLTDEWPKMTEGRNSAHATQALGLLLRDVAAPGIAKEAGAPAQAALLNAVMKVGSDRGERLALNVHRTDNTKWLVLFILGALTQVAIAIVHLEKPRAQLATTLIFTTALVSTLGLIAVHEWPFDGPAAIQPEALRQADAVIARDVTATR